MMRISLHPDTKLNFKEFKKMFGDKFLHIPKELREGEIRKEYNRIVDERKSNKDGKSEKESIESNAEDKGENSENSNKE